MRIDADRGKHDIIGASFTPIRRAEAATELTIRSEASLERIASGRFTNVQGERDASLQHRSIVSSCGSVLTFAGHSVIAQPHTSSRLVPTEQRFPPAACSGERRGCTAISKD
jgi:hypothetical protein